MRKNPPEYARWVRRVHEIPDDREVNVHDLVVRCGGRVDEIPTDGFAGLLFRSSNALFGILLREGDSARRKRFTVAHELGHFCIPWHKNQATLCVSPELSRDGTGEVVEREANEFAAELLMPRRTVERMIATGAIDLRRADGIVSLFNVSRVSAALRMCELTREAAAVAYFRDGTLKWAIRFGLPYGLPATGAGPPERTLAHDVACGKDGSPVATIVDPNDWLPLGAPDSQKGELLESSVRLDGDGEILTVLWLPEADSEMFDEDL